MLCDSNWSRKAKKHKAAKDEKETRQARVMQKGWLWPCVWVRESEKGKTRRSENISRVVGRWWNESLLISSHFFSRFFIIGKWTKNKESQTQSEVKNQPTREVLLRNYLFSCSFCVCLCHKLWNWELLRKRKSRRKFSSERGLNAYVRT